MIRTLKLSEPLACEAMGTYHHFPSKARMLDALVDRVLAAMPIPDKTLRPAARLRQFSDSWRHFSRQHPGLYLSLTLHQWNSSTGVHLMSEMLGCFHDAILLSE